MRNAPSSKLHYELATFFLSTQNDFDRYRISDPLRNQETFYRNAASSRRTGVEAYVEYMPTRSLDLQAAYTVSNFRYTNSTPIQVVMDDPTIRKLIVDGNWLPNAPRHQLCVDLQFALLSRLSVGVSAEAQTKTYIDGANVESEAADGFVLVHARIRYELQFVGFHGELSLQARNITNKVYAAFTEPDPGGNVYQPGAGREIFGGLRIRM